MSAEGTGFTWGPWLPALRLAGMTEERVARV